MVNKADTNKARLHRHKRVRGKISGTAARPRLNVFRSTNHIYAQLIDDVKGVTLAAAQRWTRNLMETAEQGSREEGWRAHCQTCR